MIRYIDIESDDRSPLLAVSATIDTDSGAFSICFTEARSMASYGNWRPDNETIIRRGSITLYEDDRLFFRKESEGNGFDMSLSNSRSGYAFATTQLPFQAGKSYRLELNIEGYPLAVAVATMPDAPVIESSELDLGQPVKRTRIRRVERFGNSETAYHSGLFYPLNVRLSDNAPERDYYLLRQRTHTQFDDNVYAFPLEVAIGNRAIIQDNPDLEEAYFLGDEEAEVYLFDCMLLSDMSFANTTGLIDLLVPFEVAGEQSSQSMCENPVHTVSYLLLSHLSQGTFAYYRSLVLQYNGIGFFTEPVSIASNIENGYGCFAALNTVRKDIADFYVCEGFWDGD
jgi:hypothetical protein